MKNLILRFKQLVRKFRVMRRARLQRKIQALDQLIPTAELTDYIPTKKRPVTPGPVSIGKYQERIEQAVFKRTKLPEFSEKFSRILTAGISPDTKYKPSQALRIKRKLELIERQVIEGRDFGDMITKRFARKVKGLSGLPPEQQLDLILQKQHGYKSYDTITTDPETAPVLRYVHDVRAGLNKGRVTHKQALDQAWDAARLKYEGVEVYDRATGRMVNIVDHILKKG